VLVEHVNALQRLFASHVLLYHSTFSHVPDDLRGHLHNVTPEELGLQLGWLKQHFDIVTVDRALLQPCSGQVAVTFDDAYESVFREGQSILDELKVPYTVFINGHSLDGQPFWRDLVRLLINRRLVEPFVAYARKRARVYQDLTPEGFYSQSKDPRFNSRVLHEVMLDFLQASAEEISTAFYCLRDPGVIRRSPYLTLGSHSFHHYVLSSLTAVEQGEEIRRNAEVLAGLGHPVSRVFAVPFGGPKDFNATTIRVVKEQGYIGIVYSRDRVNLAWKGRGGRRGGEALVSAERYMVAPTYQAFQRQMLRVAMKTASTGAT
jgi:peptidoglycan/xylan/chitin deacetylase (PgdA/CDA1 family)